MQIEAADRDPAVVEAARRNARKAGVQDCVRFGVAPLSAFKASEDYGCMVSNPPYGERLGDSREVQDLSRQMGELYRKLDTWSFFILSASTDFPRFFDAPVSKNRKLYNGNIRCYFYQYFRPMGRRAGAR